LHSDPSPSYESPDSPGRNKFAHLAPDIVDTYVAAMGLAQRSSDGAAFSAAEFAAGLTTHQTAFTSSHNAPFFATVRHTDQPTQLAAVTESDLATEWATKSATVGRPIWSAVESAVVRPHVPAVYLPIE
jgi:hypothetical protein